MQLIKIVGLVISAIAILPSVSLADTITGKDINLRSLAKEESPLQLKNLAISAKDINPLPRESYYKDNNLTISVYDTNPLTDNNHNQFLSPEYDRNNTPLSNGVYNPNSFRNNQFDGKTVKFTYTFK